MKIEPWNEQNVAYVVGLIKELVHLSIFGVEGPEFQWEYTLDVCRRIMVMPSYYLRVSIDDEGVHNGFVGGHLETMFFNPAQYAQEDAWYVRPNTPDRAKIAVALMRGFIGWGLDEKKARYVQSGDIASIDTVAVQGLYTRLGFRRFGTMYRYKRGAM